MIGTDTTIIQQFDSSASIQNGQQQIILLQDKTSKKEGSILENPFFTSVLYPILVALIVTSITVWFSRRKNRQELDKLRLETDQLKRDFQPYVLSTLNETQKEILKLKLEGLKMIVNLRMEYFHYEKEYYNGEMLFPDQYSYYEYVYQNFDKNGYLKFQNFISEYEYLYPKSVSDQFLSIKASIEKLYDSNKQSESVRQLQMSEVDYKHLKSLPGNFDNAIHSIRMNLHLDNSFVHDFLETYNIKK